MIFSKKAAMAAGLAAALSVPFFSPDLAAQNAKPGRETLVIDEATVEWIEASNVAALREGVLEKMELKIDAGRRGETDRLPPRRNAALAEEGRGCRQEARDRGPSTEA